MAKLVDIGKPQLVEDAATRDLQVKTDLLELQIVQLKRRTHTLCVLLYAALAAEIATLALLLAAL